MASNLRVASRVCRMGMVLVPTLAFALAACSPPSSSPEPAAKRAPSPFDGFRVVDLSHELSSGIPMYPGGKPFSLENMATLEQGYYMNWFSVGEHTGTHVDAPSHFAEGTPNVDELSTGALTGPLALLDISEQAEENADFAVDVQTIRAWESKHGNIPAGAFVVANSGWWRRWDNAERYLDMDKEGVMHFPGFSEEAVDFLLTERDIRGVGIDTLSADIGPSEDFPEHRRLLPTGKINLENLADLGALPESGAYILVAPLKISRGSGSPARVFAFVPTSQ